MPISREEMTALLEQSPVIAAVKSEEGFAQAIGSDCRVVFVLHGDIVSVTSDIARLKEAGKAVIVHLDLIEGLAAREVSVDFIRRTTCADGVISTRTPLVRRARQLGLLAVQRFFLLDSIALQNVTKLLAADETDFVEVLPGAMPKVIRQLVAATHKPVIAGGLIRDKEDIQAALGAGAMAISSTDEKIWFM